QNLLGRQKKKRLRSVWSKWCQPSSQSKQQQCSSHSIQKLQSIHKHRLGPHTIHFITNICSSSADIPARLQTTTKMFILLKTTRQAHAGREFRMWPVCRWYRRAPTSSP